MDLHGRQRKCFAAILKARGVCFKGNWNKYSGKSQVIGGGAARRQLSGGWRDKVPARVAISH